MYGLGDEDYKEALSFVRRKNPLENKMLSELTYDIFCLLHSYDWYASGDTDEDTYHKDVKYFMDKWLKISPDAIIEREIHRTANEMRRELLNTFLLFGENTSAEFIENACEECKIKYEGGEE